MSSLIATSVSGLVEAVRQVTRRPSNWPEAADRVAGVLDRRLPSGAEVLAGLTTDPLTGVPGQDPARVRSQVLHVEPDGSFSVVALILRPGQETEIHDHVTWCAVAMIQGLEREERFVLEEPGNGTPGRLRSAGLSLSRPGEICAFAPPGDIHRVTNVGSGPSISINVYGTDVARVGSSVRRVYAEPEE
jgi:3-mercaptopropionate dioxygenase